VGRLCAFEGLTDLDIRQAGGHMGRTLWRGLVGWISIESLRCDLLLPAAISDCIRDYPARFALIVAGDSLFSPVRVWHWFYFLCPRWCRCVGFLFVLCMDRVAGSRIVFLNSDGRY
jgi:hypothetical protein